MRRNKETKYGIRNKKYDPFQQINYKVKMSCFSFTGYNNKTHLRHENLYRWGKHDWQCGRQRDHRYCLSHYLAFSLLILPAVAVQMNRFLFEISVCWYRYHELNIWKNLNEFLHVTFILTQEWACQMLVVNDQGRCDLTKQVFGHSS